MFSSCKSIPSHIPFYFATHYRSRHAPPAPRSTSQELEAQQTEDLNAHDLLPAELRKLKQDLKLYNNLGCMVTFNTIIKDWVVVASKLGAPVLRVFADTQMRDMSWHDVAKGFTREQVRDWIADDLRECTEHGKEHGVIIGVQNHGDFLRTSDDLIELVGLVDSPWCGAIVDTGYFRSADPYVDMKKAAPYAVNWQVKQSAFGAASDVKLDLDRFLHIVRSSGYSGYLPIETLSTPDKPYDPYQIVPPFVQELKAAIARTA